MRFLSNLCKAPGANGIIFRVSGQICSFVDLGFDEKIFVVDESFCAGLAIDQGDPCVGGKRRARTNPFK